MLSTTIFYYEQAIFDIIVYQYTCFFNSDVQGLGNILLKYLINMLNVKTLKREGGASDGASEPCRSCAEPPPPCRGEPGRMESAEGRYLKERTARNSGLAAAKQSSKSAQPGTGYRPVIGSIRRQPKTGSMPELGSGSPEGGDRAGPATLSHLTVYYGPDRMQVYPSGGQQGAIPQGFSIFQDIR